MRGAGQEDFRRFLDGIQHATSRLLKQWAADSNAPRIPPGQARSSVAAVAADGVSCLLLLLWLLLFLLSLSLLLSFLLFKRSSHSAGPGTF